MDQTKTQIGQDFIASERAEYNKFVITVIAQYPISIYKAVDCFKEKYGVEVDRIEKKEAKVTLNNL